MSLPRVQVTLGDRFGSRTVVAVLDRPGRTRVRWRCDCGREGTAEPYELRRTGGCHGCQSRGEVGRRWTITCRRCGERGHQAKRCENAPQIAQEATR